MLSSMQRIMQRNLLKYSAGHHITCPKCDSIADYRAWVIWTAPSGQTGAHCDKCHREILDKVHDEKPHGYLQSIGWRFDTLIDFDKPQRKPKAAPVFPQKPGKALDNFLRKTILAGHKLANKQMGRANIKGTVYPSIVHSAEYPLTVNDDGEWSNAAITADYVRRYCVLNHLTA